MKLKWLIMKQPTMMAFKMFRKQKCTHFMLGVQPMYTRWHGNDAETNRKHFGIKSEQDEENYLRTQLESVLGELGWKLED